MKTAVDSSVLFDIVKGAPGAVAAQTALETALQAALIMRGYARNKDRRERTAPDFLIGAHAMQQADALLTTDAGFFRNNFKALSVVTPTSPT